MIAILRDYLPDRVAHQPGLEPGLFGLILVFFILFEPLGLYGRWLKIKLYFALFPLYKKATFKRQKTYTKRSEEHTSELQSLMRISYAVFCLKKKTEYHKNYECKPSH